MRTLKEIMTTISCNGMREWTDERVAQAMMEYANEIRRRYRIKVNIYKMKKEFIPFEIAVELKELGFDEFCFGEYKVSGESLDINNDMFLKNNILTKGYISAPLWQQGFEFINKKQCR